MTIPTPADPEITQAGIDLADAIADAANIVSYDGYYELDKEAIERVIGRHRLQTPASASAVPEGFALVPIEPTEAMIAAGYGEHGNRHPADCYRAMLAALEPKEPNQ